MSSFLTFPEFVSLLGSFLPLFLDNGESGQVGPRLLRLPLKMKLHVAFLGLLLFDLLPVAGATISTTHFKVTGTNRGLLCDV